MLKSIVGFKDSKAGFFIGFSLVPFSNYEETKLSLERDFKLAKKESLEPMKDNELYYLGVFDDISGQLHPVEKIYILGVKDYVSE